MSFPTQSLLRQGWAVRALSAVAIGCVLYIVYLLGKALYNAFFHPLRKFPGPKTWAASRIPYTLSIVGGRPHRKLLDLHNKYGPIVRISHEELSVIHPDAWKEVLGHRSGGRPENGKDPLTVLGNEHNVLGANHEDHSRFRRILSHGFSMYAVSEQEHLIAKQVDLLCQRLHENCAGGSRPVDMVSWYNRVTFDIISDLSWGEPLGSLEKSQDHPWIHALMSTTKTLSLLGQARRFPPFSAIFEAMIPNELKRLTEDNFTFAAENVEKRIELGVSRPDFMETMLRQKGGDRELNKEEMVANAFIIMLGGSETSSTALAGATYYLTRYPEKLAKLTDEVLSAFKTEEDINVHNIQNLPYLTAVMDETLRMSPPLPHASPRIMHKGGDVICGNFIPENTLISLPHWPMYRSALNFTLPDDFIPERWLGDPRFANDRREARKPFAFGPRNCIGMNLATTEIRIILARIVWNFEMRLAEDSKSWGEDQTAYVLWEKPPLNVHLTPRRLPGSKIQ